MVLVDVKVKYSDLNVVLDKVATLNIENNLVYKDEDKSLKSNLKTTIKFSLLTAASPLFSIVRIIRSIVFVCSGDFQRGGREFIGGLFTPLIAGGCFLSSLLSSVLYVISNRQISFYTQMRRIYSNFEAWMNGIDLHKVDLESYSKRVSEPLDFVGSSKGIVKHVWTTAPCMQPILEHGVSPNDGILDVDRVQKLFPSIKIDRIERDVGSIIIHSKYADRIKHYSVCNGLASHDSIETSCCCCYRIEGVVDRLLCCEVGQGTCSSMFNSGDSCGVVYFDVCGVGACCCYETQNHELTQLQSCIC